VQRRTVGIDQGLGSVQRCATGKWPSYGSGSDLCAVDVMDGVTSVCAACAYSRSGGKQASTKQLTLKNSHVPDSLLGVTRTLIIATEGGMFGLGRSYFGGTDDWMSPTCMTGDDHQAQSRNNSKLVLLVESMASCLDLFVVILPSRHTSMHATIQLTLTS
jgi:hypothetical protein